MIQPSFMVVFGVTRSAIERHLRMLPTFIGERQSYDTKLGDDRYLRTRCSGGQLDSFVFEVEH